MAIKTVAERWRCEGWRALLEEKGRSRAIAPRRSKLGKKLCLVHAARITLCVEDSHLTADMVRRSQRRLLQSILAVGKNSSSGQLLRPPAPPGRCAYCQKSNSSRVLLANSLSPPFRRFATSPHLEKKGKATKDTPVPDNASEKGRRSEIDPYDNTALESGISKAMARLKEALTKTRSAGRISPETIENLPVQLNIKRDPGASGTDHKERGRLGDYATVVPKGGRVMQVFVAEESVR